jgi:hypothetical protein
MTGRLEYSTGRRGGSPFPRDWGTPPEHHEERAAWIRRNVEQWRRNPENLWRVAAAMAENDKSAADPVPRVLEALRARSTSTPRSSRAALARVRRLAEE